MSDPQVQIQVSLANEGVDWTIQRDGDDFIIDVDGVDYSLSLEDLTNLRNAADVFVNGRDKSVLLPQADKPAPVYRGTEPMVDRDPMNRPR